MTEDQIFIKEFLSLSLDSSSLFIQRRGNAKRIIDLIKKNQGEDTSDLEKLKKYKILNLIQPKNYLAFELKRRLFHCLENNIFKSELIIVN